MMTFESLSSNDQEIMDYSSFIQIRHEYDSALYNLLDAVGEGNIPAAQVASKDFLAIMPHIDRVMDMWQHRISRLDN